MHIYLSIILDRSHLQRIEQVNIASRFPLSRVYTIKTRNGVIINFVNPEKIGFYLFLMEDAVLVTVGTWPLWRPSLGFGSGHSGLTLPENMLSYREHVNELAKRVTAPQGRFCLRDMKSIYRSEAGQVICSNMPMQWRYSQFTITILQHEYDASTSATTVIRPSYESSSRSLTYSSPFSRMTLMTSTSSCVPRSSSSC